MSELDPAELSVAESAERPCTAYLNITPQDFWELFILFPNDCQIAIGFGPGGQQFHSLSSTDDEDDIAGLESVTHEQWRSWLAKAGFVPQPK